MEFSDPRLIITTVGYSIAALVTIAMAFFAFSRTEKKSLAIVFVLMCLSIVAFQISHVIGINVSNSELSRKIFMWNLANIGIVIFTGHWVMAVLKGGKVQSWIMGLIDITGVTLLGFYLFSPSAFLGVSEPKLYLPNYYEPGTFYWIMRMYFNIAAVYYFYELIRAYRKTKDLIERNRYKYVFAGLMIAFVFGSMALFLVYDIPFDPMWSMFFGLYALPFLYAMIRFELMDIRIVAKRALVYAGLIIGVAIILALLNFSNEWLTTEAGWPFYLVPLASALIIVVSGLIVWQRLKESEILKYEFITVVTHKFRTPLTYIKWASDHLLQTAIPEEAKRDIGQIRASNFKLIELTNLLIGLTDTEQKDQFYASSRFNLSEVVNEVISGEREKISGKRIGVSSIGLQEMHMLTGNMERIKAVVQIMVENAINYTPQGGSITVSVREDAKSIHFEVKDTGVGITKDDLPRMFTRFFRGAEAKHIDTEGMGIGLSIAREIIRRHGGKVKVSSPGKDKGSTFGFSIPKVN